MAGVPFFGPADQYKRDAICVVCVNTQARRIEAVRLTWDDVNFEQQWVRLYTRKRRSGQLEPDYVPMNKTLYGFLHSRWKRRDKANPHLFQFVEKELDQMMPNLCEKAGIKAFGFHAIRHYVSSLMNDAGKGIKQIQRILRHKRQSTTETYLHTIDSALYDAVEALEEKAEKNRVVPKVVPLGSKNGNDEIG
jgi:integrase